MPPACVRKGFEERGMADEGGKPLQVIVGVLEKACDECRGWKTGEVREEVEEDDGWE